MGIEMLREVYDHAPADLTPAEMNLLVAVAWTARDSTREAHFRGGQEQLIDLARMDAKQLGRAFAKLEERGLQLRVPMRDREGRPRFRKDGQPLYAARGHASVLRIPHLAPAAEPSTDPVDNPAKTPTNGGLPERERPPKTAGKTPENGSKDPRFRGSQEVMGSQGKSDLRARDFAPVIEAVEDRTGKTIDADHARRVITQITVGHPEVRKPIAYAVAVIRNDDNPHRFLPTTIPPRYRPEDR